MGDEYKAKVFKSGNSMALRLPKALGLKEGTEMVLREMQHGYKFEPAPDAGKKIDLTGIYGAIPGLSRATFDHKELDWEGKAGKRG